MSEMLVDDFIYSGFTRDFLHRVLVAVSRCVALEVCRAAIQRSDVVYQPESRGFVDGFLQQYAESNLLHVPW